MNNPNPPTPKGSKLRKHEIAIPHLEDLLWDAPNAVKSIQTIYDYLRDDALSSINWYTRQRKKKRFWAISIRNISVVLAGIGAIIPLISTVLNNKISLGIDSGIIVTIVLALAGGLILFDKILGISSGWIRYIKTELKIRQALELFELDWEAQRASWLGNPPSSGQIASILQKATNFASELNNFISDETNAWIEEFQNSLKQIDDMVKIRSAEAQTRSDSEKPGLVNLTVTNGDQSNGGWKLLIDDNIVNTYNNKSAVLQSLKPGPHVIRIEGNISGKPVNSEKAFSIPAGGIISLEIVLE